MVMKNYGIKYILGSIILAGIIQLLTSPLPAADHGVVFQYHHISGNTPPSTSIPPQQFEAHLDYLEKNNFHVLPLDSMVTLLREGGRLPDRSVAITMDDAYTSIYTEAFPRLRRRNWPFTVFVATEGVDREYKNLLSWDQIREMAEYGAGFESHGHTHSHLIRRKPGESEEKWKKRVTEDITISIRRLREELGTNSGLFAYPYGEYSDELKKIVLNLGLTGFGQHSGPIWSEGDFGALPRFPVSGIFADLDQFALKAQTLPLPVIHADPSDPVLPPGVTRPALQLKLAPGGYNQASLACFISGEGRAEIQWINGEENLIRIRPGEPLPPGRSRFNITAPSMDGKRYYWYSHLWIRPAGG